MNITVIKDGKVKLTVPSSHLKWEGDYPLAKSAGTWLPFISRGACEAAGLDPKAVQADFIAGRRSLKSSSALCLKFGENPDGTILADEAVEFAKRSEESDRRKREKYADQIAEAARTGNDIQISTEKWTETRRVQEGGEWGEYQFLCSRVEWVTPQGEFKSRTSAVNTY